jgi:hypothetical protein
MDDGGDRHRIAFNSVHDAVTVYEKLTKRLVCEFWNHPPHAWELLKAVNPNQYGIDNGRRIDRRIPGDELGDRFKSARASSDQLT